MAAVAAAYERLQALGVEVIAVSTDNVEDLKKSIDNYDGGPLPIPLLSNAELDVFKQFRAYDDFENLTLHGTFLIDERGLVRWQDISFEPFMDPKFVLGEAKRLLAFLEWFLPIDIDLIPENSIAREFLGGSILKNFKLWKDRSR